MNNATNLSTNFLVITVFWSVITNEFFWSVITDGFFC